MEHGMTEHNSRPVMSACGHIEMMKALRTQWNVAIVVKCQCADTTEQLEITADIMEWWTKWIVVVTQRCPHADTLEQLKSYVTSRYVRRSVMFARGYNGTPGASCYIRHFIMSVVVSHRSILSASGQNGTTVAFH